MECTHDTDATICRGVTIELHDMTAKCIQKETVGTSHQELAII